MKYKVAKLLVELQQKVQILETTMATFAEDVSGELLT
jgi:hypothetical protein